MVIDDFLRIRAYNMGVGDCFLLTFVQSNKEFTMLIDCGSRHPCKFQDNILPVIDNINELLESKKLDVLVISHTDDDHINGLGNPNLPKLETAPSEIWVPLNCHPAHKTNAKYKAVEEMSRCLSSFGGLRQVIQNYVDLYYWARVSKIDCLDELEKRYPDAKIKYLHSAYRPIQIGNPSNNCSIEILNPPPPASHFLRVMLDLIPIEILEETGLFHEEIMSIKERNRDFEPWFDEEMLPEVLEALEDLEHHVETEQPELSEKDFDSLTRLAKSLLYGGKVLKKDVKRLCKSLRSLYISGFITRLDFLKAIRPVLDEANQYSLVFNLNWAGRNLLFTGDLVDWSLITTRLTPVTLLKVPHHGGHGKYIQQTRQLTTLIPTHPAKSSPLAIIPTCSTKNLEPCCIESRSPDPQTTRSTLLDIGFSCLDTCTTLTNSPLYTDVYIHPKEIPTPWSIHLNGSIYIH